MKSPGAIAFSIFGIDIRYYGILIAIGMAACMLISLRRTAQKESIDIFDINRKSIV